MRTRAEAADRHSRDAESLASRAQIVALRASQRSDDPTADEDREADRGS